MPHLTEDGEPILLDELLFNYYDMKPGRFEEIKAQDNGWGTFCHTNGTRSILNGERVCSIRWAWAKGWLKCWCGRPADGINGPTDASPEQPACELHPSEAGGYREMKDWLYRERERMVLDYIAAESAAADPRMHDVTTNWPLPDANGDG